MSRELLIVVLFGLFCCVIVVCCSQFICGNYSRVRLQFVQRVSSFSRINVSWICRVNYWLSCCLDCSWCHRRVLCAIHFWQPLTCLHAIRAACKFFFAKFFLKCVACTNIDCRAVWVVLLCHCRMMCANNCGNHRDTYIASKNYLNSVCFVARSVYIVFGIFLSRVVFCNALVATIRRWLTQRVRLSSFVLICLLLV